MGKLKKKTDTEEYIRINKSADWKNWKETVGVGFITVK